MASLNEIKKQILQGKRFARKDGDEWLTYDDDTVIYLHEAIEDDWVIETDESPWPGFKRKNKHGNTI